MEQLRQQDMVQKVKHYLEHKLPITTLKPYEKGPNTPGWNSDKSTLVNTFQKADNIADQNIGLCLAWGVDAAGNSKPWATLDVDDLQRTREIFDGQGISLDDLIYGLDSVTIESGVPNRTKALFRLSKPLKKYQHSEGGKMIFEFRCADSNGNTDQDVLPPSIHPKTNQKYQWGGKGNWAATPMMPDALVNLWQAYLVSDKPKANGKASLDVESLTAKESPTLEQAVDWLNNIRVASLSRKDWIIIGMAINNIDSSDNGLRVFNRWSLDDERYDPVEIVQDWNSFKPGGGITGWTILHYVRDGHSKIPDNGFLLPSLKTGHVSHIDSAKHIWAVARKYGKAFNRNGIPVEISDGSLVPITSVRLVVLVEELAALSGQTLGTLKAYGEGKLKWGSCSLSRQKADPILQARGAVRDGLNEIRMISQTPFLTADGVVLSKGYHKDQKVLVLDGEVAEVSIDVATNALKDLLQDFKGQVAADTSRMMAAILTPATKPGKVIDGHSPIFLFEANESQTGKGTYAEMFPIIYGDRSASVKQTSLGHNSVDRQIDTALVDGRNFICLDNFRGELNIAALESLITGEDSSHITSKKFGHMMTISPGDFNWAITSNGVKTTEDMFNRYCMIAMRKHPVSYRWSHGDKQGFHRHIRATQPYYLGCVFAVLKKWIDDGRPITYDHGHSFGPWAGAMDHIVQNYFNMAPLMEGMMERKYAFQPGLKFLRDLTLAVKSAGSLGEYMGPAAIALIAAEANLMLPNKSLISSYDERNANIQMGNTLKKIFNDGEVQSVAEFSVVRHIEPSGIAGRNDKLTYAFTEAADA